MEESGEGAALIETWKGVDFVILVDAVQSGGTAGIIYRFDAIMEPIPGSFFHYSTHAFSVAEAVELARARSINSQAGSLFSESKGRPLTRAWADRPKWRLRQTKFFAA